jgi:hypothetical protein
MAKVIEGRELYNEKIYKKTLLELNNLSKQEVEWKSDKFGIFE